MNISTDIFRPYLSSSIENTHSWAIEKSSLGGRGLFAQALIKKGTLIFCNKPLILGPRTHYDVETYCAYCYEISSSCYACDKCLIIVCSKKCETSENHLKECSYISDNWKPPKKTADVPKTLTKAIMYLRGILLANDQIGILNLLQKCDIKPSTYDFDELCTTCVMPDQQVQFLKKIYGILRANSFRINKKAQNKVPLRGLYPVSSFLNHSCLPNTRNAFHKDYSMSVYATRDINKGEEILCCYTGLLWCSPMRRIQLYKSKNFWCRCKRCCDPSELGTNLGALKCVDLACDGYLLPLCPLNPKSNWECGVCNTSVTSNKINTVHSILGSLVGTLDVEDLELKDNIVQKLKLFIPDCNQILVEIRLRIAIAMGYTKVSNVNSTKGLIFSQTNDTYYNIKQCGFDVIIVIISLVIYY